MVASPLNCVCRYALPPGAVELSLQSNHHFRFVDIETAIPVRRQTGMLSGPAIGARDQSAVALDQSVAIVTDAAPESGRMAVGSGLAQRTVIRTGAQDAKAGPLLIAPSRRCTPACVSSTTARGCSPSNPSTAQRAPQHLRFPDMSRALISGCYHVPGLNW
jgi:hypothetical protein